MSAVPAMRSRAARKPEPPLTTEQLELAFRHLRRPGWPATLEAALADPFRAPCVRGLARNLSRGGTGTGKRFAPFTPPGAPPLPPTPTAPPRNGRPAHPVVSTAPRRATPRPRTPAAPRFDARKAAANDLDD